MLRFFRSKKSTNVRAYNPIEPLTDLIAIVLNATLDLCFDSFDVELITLTEAELMEQLTWRTS